MTNYNNNDITIEYRLLAHFLTRKPQEKFQDLIESVAENDFYYEIPKNIFIAIREMFKTGEKINNFTIKRYLKSKLMNFGEENTIGGLVGMVGFDLPFDHHLSEFNDQVSRRKLSKGVELLNAKLHMGATKEELESSLGELSKALDGSSSQVNGHLLEDGLSDWLDNLEANSQVKGLNGLSMGHDSIDNVVHGLGEGWLVVVAGRPSHGKTYMSQLFMDAVMNQERLLFFSLEMSENDIYNRFFAIRSNIEEWKIRKGQITDNEDWGRISNATVSLKESKLILETLSQPKLSKIKQTARAWKAKYPDLKAIYIDYLGLIKLGEAQRHDIAVGDVAVGLKSLAQELKLPVVVLAQANRGMDAKKRPQMSDLKDSSVIEATADLVLFVNRPQVSDPETPLQGITELIWAKDRHNGFNGTLYFSGGLNEVNHQEVAMLLQREEENNAPKGRKWHG